MSRAIVAPRRELSECEAGRCRDTRSATQSNAHTAEKSNFIGLVPVASGSRYSREVKRL